MKSMLSGLVLSMAFASAAHAAPVVYTNAASFTAGTTGVSTQTFDGVGDQSGTIVTPGFTVTSTAASVGTAFYGSGKSLQYSTFTSAPLVFTFTSAISAFGFDLYDLGTVGQTTLTATYNGQSVNLLSNYTGSASGRLFAGFSDASTSFTTLTLSNSANGDFIELDNVRSGVAAVTGAVPEPATWAMMIFGFGMIGFGMRYGVRRSNAKFDLKIKRIGAGLEA